MSDALYYPYMNIRNTESLKSMVLYFDKIHIINPLMASIGSSYDNSELNELEHNGVIRFLSPLDLLKNYDDIMTQSVMGDLTDPTFLSVCQQVDQRSWEIHTEKVPSGFLDASYRKYLVDIPNFYQGQSAKYQLREGPFHSIHENHEYYENIREINENRDRHFREYRQVTLPFPVGESIMINHALCASSFLNLIPITDDAVQHDFLMFKFNRMQKSNFLRKILKDYRFIKNIKNDLTAVNVISETIPSLTGASITDLLEFRDENKDSLNRFKIEIGKLSSEIETSFWDADFHKKIIDAVDSKVKPSIEELNTSFESTKERMVRIFKKGVEIAPLPIFASVVPGCNPEMVLAASAGIIALSEYLENTTKRNKAKRKNGFAYLFDVKKKFVVNK
jgi:hypothetical protein